MQYQILFLLCFIVIPVNARAADHPTPAHAQTEQTASHQVVIKWKDELQHLTPQQKLKRTVRQHAHRPLKRAETHIISDHAQRNFSVVSSRDLSTADLIRQFEDLPTVEYAHENLLFRAQAQVTPWGVDSAAGVNATTAHASGYTGQGTIVAIIDTGIDLDHEDLDANIWTPAGNDCAINGTFTAGGCPNGGYDFVNSDNDPTDDNGHGTHVAGSVAAEDNDTGVIGVAPDAQLMAVKVLGDDGFGTYDDIVSGIDFAVDNGADVINISLGAMNDDEVYTILQDAIEDAEGAGVTVVAATGNYSSNAAFLPSQFAEVISVSAVQQTALQENPDTSYGTRLGYISNWGKVTVAAPGMRINSTTYDGLYSGNTWSGTSMATPHVAGVVALLKEKNSALTPAQIRFILETTAADNGDIGKDEFFGSGIVDADAALDALDSTTETLALEANWSENSTAASSPGYSVEPTMHSTMIPADSVSSTTLRIRARTANGTALASEGVDLTTTGGLLSASTATTDANGEAEFTLTAPATAGTATVTATLSDSGATASVVIHFADTLLVTDAGQPLDPGNEGWFFTQALEAIGVEWLASSRGYPEDETELANFDRVLWHSGRYGLNESEQQNIKDYLDGGGNIFVSGGDILYTYYYYSSGEGTDETHDEDIVFNDAYLNVGYSNYVASDLTFLGDGNFESIGADIEDFGSESANFGYTDVVTAGSNGVVGGYFCSNEQDALVTVDSTYRSAFLGVGLEVVEKTYREEIIDSALDFLSGDAPSGGSYDAPSTCDSSDTADDGTATDPEVDAEPDETLPEPGQPDAEEESDSPEVLFNLSVDEIDATTATVSWETDEVLAYSVMYAENVVDNQNDSSALGDVTSATIENLQPDTTYNFTVYGVYDDDSFTAAHTVSGTTPPLAPSIPTLVTAKRRKLTVSLADPWSTGYQFRVRVSDADGVDFEEVTLDVGDTEVTFSGLEAKTIYQITAALLYVDENSEEVISDYSEALTTETLTDRVKRPKVEKRETGRVRIRWEKPPGKIAQYRIQLWEKQSGEYVKVRVVKVNKHLKKDVKKKWIAHLVSDTKYRVRVRAVFNNGDNGTFSKYRRLKTVQE